jgi:hypothetical protein
LTRLSGFVSCPIGNEVSAHDFVFGELLIGDKGGLKQLLADY